MFHHSHFRNHSPTFDIHSSMKGQTHCNLVRTMSNNRFVPMELTSLHRHNCCSFLGFPDTTNLSYKFDILNYDRYNKLLLHQLAAELEVSQVD